MGATRLQDVLRQATSVNLLELEPQNAYAGIRGNLVEGYPKNIQVLIDGVPFYNNVRGAVDLDSLPIPIALIETIEIVRGPSSPLYGAGAVGGVIAISTRRSAEASGSLQAGAGEARRRLSADFTQQVGRLHYAFGFDAGSSGDSGFPTRALGDVNPFFRPTPEQSEQLREDATHQHRALFRGDATFGTSRFTLSAGTAAKRTGTNFGSGFVIPYERFRNDFAKAAWQQEWTPGLKSDLSVHTLDITSVTGDFRQPESTLIDYHSRQVSLLVNASPAPDVHLVAGWDARNSVSSSILGGPLKDARDHAWGVFLLADWGFLPGWNLGAGGRFERDTLGGARLSPRLVLGWSAGENVNLRLGYYTAARSPQVLEARIAASTPTRIIPNPELQVERTESLELGYRQAWAGWTVDATLFETGFTDLIARRTVLPTPPPSGTRQYVNIPGKARDRGMELAVQRSLGPATVGANWTQLRFRDPDHVDYVYTARTQANLFARAGHGRLHGYAGLQYVGPHRIGNYLGTPTFEELPGRVRGQLNLGVDLTGFLQLSIYGRNLGGRHDGQGAGGPLQSPILRGVNRDLGASLALHW